MLLPSPLALFAFLSLFAAQVAALSCLPRRPVFAAGGLSLLTALAAGILTPLALALCLAALALAWLAREASIPSDRCRWLAVACGVWALAAALHLLPGFTPHVWTESFGRAGHLPLRWSFDKGFAGLVLILALPATGRMDLRRGLWLLPAGFALPTACLLAGLVEPDPRWLAGALVWLGGNLFLTVIAEEAFFRGLLQGGLQARWGHQLPFPLIVVLVSALFALAHLPWGGSFAGLAFLAGLLYGFMAGPRRILPAAIAVHFLTNAGFLLLTRSPLG